MSCFGRISLRRQDYYDQCWKKGERTTAVVLSGLAVCLLAWFFYRSLWAAIPLSAAGVLCFCGIRRKSHEKAGEELGDQFRECILSVAAALQAGYSAENAFRECRKDMELMYGRDAMICRELLLIHRGLDINITLEELLADMGRRSGSDEIRQFAEVFAAAKRNGGNLSEIIKSSAALIGRKIEVRQEIRAILGGRKMELSIMKGMPFAILTYISFSNPGYFDRLYHNPQGIIIMTGCLGIYLVAFVLGEWIMEHLRAELE